MVPFIIFMKKNHHFLKQRDIYRCKGKKTMRELLFILCLYLWVAEYYNIKRSVPLIVDDMTSLFKDIVIGVSRILGRITGKIIRFLKYQK